MSQCTKTFHSKMLMVYFNINLFMIIYDATHGGVDLSLRYSKNFVMFERVGGMRLMRMDGVGGG